MAFARAPMNQLLISPAAQNGLGLEFPPWFTAVCLGLFVMAGLYTAFLLLAGPRQAKWLQYLLPQTLRARMVLGFGIAISLPLIALVLAGTFGLAVIWIVGAVTLAVCLATGLSRGITIPLGLLDHAIREFNLKSTREPMSPPYDAPNEVVSVFTHLASLDKRLRATFRKLGKSLSQGEKLRAELIYIVAKREKEIEKRVEELNQANDSLRKISREDKLTGLSNRRRFAEFLLNAWRNALREEQALSILMIDIDDFKSYNDHHGHKKGDACLKIVAESIRRTVGRASDLVSRYGGEEFVVVLGNTPLEGALKIAENIRVAIENLGILHKGAKDFGMMTVSIGVTSTLPTRETQPETVLVAADRAMYNAKHNGKNKVAYSTSARTGIYQALCLPSNMETRM
jgi:diguanylate cyclase (GGDEF)-like protein